jgi:hypothetical protein
MRPKWLKVFPGWFLLGFKRRLVGLKSKRRLPGLRPERRRLTSRFGKIENVKNFDVEKMVLLKIVFYRKL